MKTKLLTVILSLLLAFFSTTCLAIGPGKVSVYNLNDPDVPSYITVNAPVGATQAVLADFHVGLWAEVGHENSYVYFDTHFLFADANGNDHFICVWSDDAPAPPELFTVSDGMRILMYTNPILNCLVSDFLGPIPIASSGFAFGQRVNLLTVPKNGDLLLSRIVKDHNGIWTVPFAAGAYPELHETSFEFHYLNDDLFDSITPDGIRFEFERYTEGFHVMGDEIDSSGNSVGVASQTCSIIDAETAKYLAAMAVATSGYDGGGVKILGNQITSPNNCTDVVRPFKATYYR